MNEFIINTKPCLVLIHGWGLNHAVWQQVVTSLEPAIDVISLDLAGYGLNSQLPAPYALSALADDLVAKIPTQSLVLGWSLGGLVALQMAMQAPDKVKALALVATSPCFLAKDDWPGMSSAVLQQFAEALSQNIPLTIERFLAIQAMGSQTARQDIKLLKQAVLSLPPPKAAALSGGLDLLRDTDLRQQLSELKMPVSGCFGRLDSLVPVKIIPLLQQLLPTAHWTIIDKASHAPFISHPTEFGHWLQQWVLNHCCITDGV